MKTESRSDSYAAAGVDITAGYKAVELMKKHIARTMTNGDANDIGGFGGLFALDLTGYTKPVLVSGTDGVGTKLKIAFLMDKHDTVGIDCVAMCVNDVICCGAKPLFFLDYIACGKNFPEKIADIVGGIAEGCVQSGSELIGGETAEMPGFYPIDEYDLAGFSVGIVDRDKVIDKASMKAGDVMIALPSSGVHSNGFSLVRKVFDVLSQAKLPIHLSEITITAPDNSKRGQMVQAIIMRNLYRAWFAVEKMNGITWWNVVDDCGAPGEPSISGLFTRDLRPKTVYYAMKDLIHREWKTHLTVKAKGGKVSFRGFKGCYNLEWKNPDGTSGFKSIEVK